VGEGDGRIRHGGPGHNEREARPGPCRGTLGRHLAASLALFVVVRTIGRAPFVGLLCWITAAAPAPTAHPTSAQTLTALPVTLGLFILTLAGLVVLAGPVLVPLLAAGHIVVSWRRGGER